MAIQQLSQANLSYISKQKQAQKPKNIIETKLPLAPLKADELVLSDSAKKADKNKKFKIACYSLLALNILVQLIVDYKRNHLAKHIDFEPAKTLEEAKNFARKHLKINSFNLEDLDCANYVNEALCAFNNSSKRHEKLISEVISVDKTSNKTGVPLFSIAVNVAQKGELEVCEKNILKALKECFEDISTAKDAFLKGKGVDEKIRAIYQKFLADPKSLSFKEKMNFMVFCDAHTENLLFEKTTAIFAQYLSDENCVKYLKANNYPTTIKEFSKLALDERTSIITKLLANTDHKYQIYSTGEFGLINHEIGHVMHHRHLGSNYSYVKVEDKLTYQEVLDKAKADGFSGAVFDNVGWYALTSKNEFVAEIYSYLKAGHKLCSEIMKKYFSLGGVLP